MAFYPVIEMETLGRKTRVYVVTKITTLKYEDAESIKKQVEETANKNKELLAHGHKYVLIMWSDNNITMTDWWVWGEKESESEGSSVEVYLFRGTEGYESPVVTAEDGLKILAQEANPSV